MIELPAAAVAHSTFLGYLTKSYQRYGFKVAGNLPNAGQIMSVSEMARLDFIKMDAGLRVARRGRQALVGYANRLRIPLIFSHVPTRRSSTRYSNSTCASCRDPCSMRIR